MKVVVNGEAREVGEGCCVNSLLKELGLTKSACAVEVNKRLVPKTEHEKRSLNDGDRVEVVTLVGGG